MNTTTPAFPSGNNGSPDTPPGAATVDRAVQGAREVVDRLADKAVPAVERLRSGVTVAVDSVGSTVKSMAMTGDEWLESCRTTVRAHPMKAVGAAAAVGYLLARLIRR